MVSKIIEYSIQHKFYVLLFVFIISLWGIWSLTQIRVGAVPDITNNQVQVLTTSENLSTQDVEQFITYPIELAMANLPGVKEIRSVSKFGLSVVTIVFEDELGTWLPRQLIAEKIEAAKQKIPKGFGIPEMGPITTGLGEIYQYTLDTKPGYKDKYTAMDLRTIQDWVVKRYLSGIPGVIEVNSWGGFLKQYEVAIDPAKLQAMSISINSVFDALSKTNENTGGAYIEKGKQSYFIRGEGMVKSLSDIEKTVVEVRNKIPLLIRDIAEVKYGYANRYGAITANGEGEKVLGQVMMLKDANSNKVIADVKERVEELRLILPEGVIINGFLDRSELIERTTKTIAENLLLGALIVIFVVVLLLGNFRSGLIVASVIPISMLISIGMMNQLGISANLMSLGAIDFGIIIDGAIIIVEFTLYKMITKSKTYSSLDRNEKSTLRNSIAYEGSSKMMKSAIFGQIIILIVFIPILSLSGIEGKMFKPMGLAFSFALGGAILLCLTYIPAMSALVLNPNMKPKNISIKIISFLQTTYEPVIKYALKHRIKVLVGALLLFAGSSYMYTKMGGEFIPTLDEGDYVVQPILRQGTSLSETVLLTTRMEQILLDNFPEVDQVVTRIGAAEIPTDPMSMEESDVIIKLKPRDQWTSASSKDELANLMKEKLSVIPGVEYEFTQPIEMRFNELITGVRSDVAIKIFGENMDSLHNVANRIKSLIENVHGVADISVEKTAGLTQIRVDYNRNLLARYGLQISEVNRIIRIAYSGESVGTVFEGERSFDMVVRLNRASRQNPKNLENLYISVPTGQMVPLKEFAKVTYTEGPAKISRDNTRRRVVVGINVRNRDLESLVLEVQEMIDTQIELPIGYYVNYGGQFENLRNAKERLMIAVPIALILIFLMLYFTFKSLGQTLMIYTAIPLASIGGVVALWIRDMPFSISAGIGFIALFGIAVLNGIVLIEYLNELKVKGISDLNDRIIMGTTRRLRPVLMTASAAALGFFPMAFSESAGAEVQRPLATVVIGGLITATLLTMIILPVIYSLVEKRREGTHQGLAKVGKSIYLFLILILGFPLTQLKAQDRVMNFDEIMQEAIQNNAELKSYQYAVETQRNLEKTAIDLGFTGLYFDYNENNISPDGFQVNTFGIRQQFLFPTTYSRRKVVLRLRTNEQEYQYESASLSLKNRVANAYLSVLYQKNKVEWLEHLDSLLENFSRTATLRFELGETELLDKVSASVQHGKVSVQLQQAQNDLQTSYINLRELVQIDNLTEIVDAFLTKLEVSGSNDFETHPYYQYMGSTKYREEAEHQLIRSFALPTLDLMYSRGFEVSEGTRQFNGFTIGVALPLFFNAQKARSQSAEKKIFEADQNLKNVEIKLRSRIQSLNIQLKKYEETLVYYETKGLDEAALLDKAAQLKFEEGSFEFLKLLVAWEMSINLRLNYLNNLYQYNVVVNNINYLTLNSDQR